MDLDEGYEGKEELRMAEVYVLEFPLIEKRKNMN